MRLTYKYENDNGYGSVKLKNLPPDPLVDKLPYLDNAWEEQRNKLGQLEDIEEELGIELVVLFEAIKNGIYTKTNSKNKKSVGYDYEENILYSIYGSGIHKYHIEDYGKTWALDKKELTKEELE